MYDKVFCPMLAFQKRCLTIAKLVLVSILQSGANLKIKLLHLCIGKLFFGRQPTYRSNLRKRYKLYFI